MVLGQVGTVCIGWPRGSEPGKAVSLALSRSQTPTHSQGYTVRQGHSQQSQLQLASQLVTDSLSDLVALS